MKASLPNTVEIVGPGDRVRKLVQSLTFDSPSQTCTYMRLIQSKTLANGEMSLLGIPVLSTNG